jgi:hypothetical protein
LKKINYLLHNVTVVNFLLIGRLAIRYRAVSLLGIISFLALVPYFYFSQPVVYQKEVHFKVLNQNNITPDKGAADVVQNITTALNMPEIMGAISSYHFITSISERLALLPDFKELIFDHPLVTSSASQTLVQCESQECRVKILRNLVSNLYSISAEQSTGKFTLKITTRSSKTTMQVLKAFQLTLDEVRVNNARELADRQLAQLQELALKSKSDIEAKGGFEKIASSEFLDALISQNKDKIRNLSQRLIKDDNQFYAQGVKLHETNLVSDTAIEGKEKLSYENFVKTNKRIEELRQNIASINATPVEARTQGDNLVLNELKKELVANEEELKRIGHMNRNIALDDRFLDSQRGNKSTLEYNYKVTSAQVKKLRDQYEAAKRELDNLYSKKAALENELVALKPDLEYLKLLESKLVSMKFKLSSISSDVMFENYGTEVSSFKRNSLFKIFVFSFLFIAFLLFIVYMFLYLMDDRIFEEQEIDKVIDELPVVGYAPHYE